MSVDLAPIHAFLRCETPEAWLAAVPRHLDTLLIDHANCEKKAAGTALSLLYKYTEHTTLLNRLSKLAREELRHFEQVVAILAQRDIAYVHVSSSRYAGRLRDQVSKRDPERLVDFLLTGAIVEARSCERFAALVPILEPALSEFYAGLMASEARHFEVYLQLARSVAEFDVSARLDELLDVEAALITGPDPEFRFHSGVPAESTTA